MFRGVFAREWIERPQGTLGRTELRALVQRLGRIPAGFDSVRIEWDKVTHLDFRAIADLETGVRDLLERGIAVRCTGLSPYVAAILRFALPLDGAVFFGEYVTAAPAGPQTGADGDRAGGCGIPSFIPSRN